MSVATTPSPADLIALAAGVREGTDVPNLKLNRVHTGGGSTALDADDSVSSPALPGFQTTVRERFAPPQPATMDS